MKAGRFAVWIAGYRAAGLPALSRLLAVQLEAALRDLSDLIRSTPVEKRALAYRRISKHR